MNFWYYNNIFLLVPDWLQKQRAAPLTWELVNTVWLLSAHKLVSSVGLLRAFRLGPAAPRRKPNAHVANRQTWVRANMAHLLKGRIRDNRLSSFTLLFTSGPSSTSLLQFKANYSASDYYGMRSLTVSHLHGNAALSLPFSIYVCLSESSSSSLCFCLWPSLHTQGDQSGVHTHTHSPINTHFTLLVQLALLRSAAWRFFQWHLHTHRYMW